MAILPPALGVNKLCFRGPWHVILREAKNLS